MLWASPSPPPPSFSSFLPPQILENFKIETKRAVEVGTKFDLILLPDKPIYLTLRPLQRPA